MMHIFLELASFGKTTRASIVIENVCAEVNCDYLVVLKTRMTELEPIIFITNIK